MIASRNQRDAIEKLCVPSIKKILGDISTLPQELTMYVKRVYCNFFTSYINFLRQKEKKPAEWIPETLSIDPKLANDMRHFFSDYQHITREYFLLNSKMERLLDIDKKRQPNLYQYTIDDILKLGDRSLDSGE